MDLEGSKVKEEPSSIGSGGLDRSELLRLISEEDPMAMVIIDARSFRIEWCNRSFERLIQEFFEPGLSAQYRGRSVTGVTLTDLGDGFERTGAVAVYRKVVETGQPHIEEEFRTETGQGTRYWQWRVLPVSGDRGQVARIMTIFTEVTQQVADRLKAEENEARFRSLYENSDDAMMLTRPDGSILAANPAAQRLFGMTEDEVREAGRAGILVADEAAEKAIRERVKVGRAKADLTYRSKNGTTFIGETTSSVFSDSDGNLKTSLVIRDVSERKRTEKALKESEELLRTVLHNSLDGISMMDLRTGRYIIMNPAQAEITGFTMDEFNEMNVEPLERMHPGDRHLAVEQQQRVAAGKDIGEAVEYRWKVKSGEYRWFSDRRKLVRDEHGKPVAWVSIGRDITERKRAEIALQESQQDLALAQSVSMTGNWRLHVGSNELLWSDETYRIFGMPRGTPLTYETFLSTVHPDDRQYVDEKWRAALRGDEYDIEHRIVVEGGTRWVREKAIIEFDGGAMSAGFGTVQDITARKLAEKELEETKARLEAILNQMPVGITVISAPGGEIIYQNKEVARLLRSELSPASGIEERQKSQVFHLDGRPVQTGEHNIGQSLMEGIVIRDRVEKVLRGDGTYGFLSTTSAPICDKGGNIVAAIAMNIDVTEQYEAQQEREVLRGKLERYADELKRSNQDLQQFASVASHDLKEPLRMVIGFLELIRQRSKLDDRSTEYMHFAMDGIKRMSGMIDDLLAYSRVESRGMRFVQVDMDDILATVLRDLNVSIQESGAAITSDPLPTVTADMQQMVQLLENLVGNAIKYHGADAPQVHVSAHEGGSEWTFAVRDNGIGIDPKHKDRLFQMFQRLHTRDEYPGTGIGLAVSRRIVERHGGRIWLESDGRNGSTFYFSIPKAGGGNFDE